MENNKTTTMSYKELTRIAQTGINETTREMARQALKDLYPTKWTYKNLGNGTQEMSNDEYSFVIG